MQRYQSRIWPLYTITRTEFFYISCGFRKYIISSVIRIWIWSLIGIIRSYKIRGMTFFGWEKTSDIYVCERGGGVIETAFTNVNIYLYLLRTVLQYVDYNIINRQYLITN